MMQHSIILPAVVTKYNKCLPKKLNISKSLDIKTILQRRSFNQVKLLIDILAFI